MMQFKDIKSNAGEVEVKGTTVSGYFAHFNSTDYDSDIIVPGAFEKSISERGAGGTNQIMHLLQHDSWKPLGKPSVLKEDSTGLYFETLITDTDYGVNTLKLYAAGVYNEHSIGFQTLQSEWKLNDDGEKQYRVIKEAKLWEGSTVTWGANDNTPFTGFKSAEKPQIIERLGERMDKLQRALKDNKFDKNTITQIQYEIEVVTKIIKSLDKAEQPVDTTVHTTQPAHDELVRSFFKSFTKNLQ